ncbi:unnamed protein product [Arabis nemorensis]|uniref:Uncharacterized protein n=1 Tax=Arabis nemorensis TaxID=586526 RepID=A0A565B641_9BRAS|nr:unnamed protein product [Arabis nemorensis]
MELYNEIYGAPIFDVYDDEEPTFDVYNEEPTFNVYDDEEPIFDVSNVDPISVDGGGVNVFHVDAFITSLWIRSVPKPIASSAFGEGIPMTSQLSSLRHNVIFCMEPERFLQLPFDRGRARDLVASRSQTLNFEDKVILDGGVLMRINRLNRRKPMSVICQRMWRKGVSVFLKLVGT